MDELVLIVPMPPRGIRPNSRYRSWRAYGATAKKYKNLCGMMALASMSEVPEWKKASVRPTFYFKTDRGRDDDNLIASLKHAIDGIVAAGVMVNDKGLSWGKLRKVVDKKIKDEYVVLHFKEKKR